MRTRLQNIRKPNFLFAMGSVLNLSGTSRGNRIIYVRSTNHNIGMHFENVAELLNDAISKVEPDVKKQL